MQQTTQHIIACFGEFLMRFSPQMQGGFIETNTMPVYIGGAELNVASALANWQVPVKYISALPDNNLSTEIKQHLTNKNIDVTNIQIGGERIGSYYLPQGTDLKHNAVIYDRKYSSFSQLKVGDIDWKTVLQNVTWFHFTAISPALSQQAADVCLEALQAATALGITISVDLNYRAKLWQYGKHPIDIMPQLLQYCHVIMGNIWAANIMAGTDTPGPIVENVTTQVNLVERANLSAKQILATYKNCHTVANTFRFDEGATGIKYYATIHTNTNNNVSSIYTTNTVVDKIGSGDCFMAGLIYGISNNHQSQAVIDFAAAAAFAKLQQKGDATTSTLQHINNTIQPNG